jgi:hypothetical protein
MVSHGDGSGPLARVPTSASRSPASRIAAPSPAPAAPPSSVTERHVAWIADCLAYLCDRRHGTIEATAAAAAARVAHVNAVADLTLYPRANSWYMGANISGKSRSFMPYIGGVETDRLKCAGVAARGYAGFNLPA